MRIFIVLLLSLVFLGIALTAPGSELASTLRLHARELLALASFGALGGIVLWQLRG